MAVEYPTTLAEFRSRAVEVHAQIERLALANHNDRTAMIARHSAELAAAIQALRDILDPIETWAYRPEKETT